MYECASPAIRNMVSISGLQTAVHERHLPFVLIVRDGANPANNQAGVPARSVIHQQSLEEIDLDVRVIRQ